MSLRRHRRRLTARVGPGSAAEDGYAVITPTDDRDERVKYLVADDPCAASQGDTATGQSADVTRICRPMTADASVSSSAARRVPSTTDPLGRNVLYLSSPEEGNSKTPSHLGVLWWA